MKTEYLTFKHTEKLIRKLKKKQRCSNESFQNEFNKVHRINGKHSHKLLTFQSDLIGKTRYDQNES